MNGGMNRVLTNTIFIVAGLLVMVGIVVSVQMGSNINEINETVDAELTGYDSIDEDVVDLDLKQSMAWAWIPFLVSLVVGLFLAATGMILEHLNEIRRELYDTNGKVHNGTD